jgi:hypothetical protein
MSSTRVIDKVAIWASFLFDGIMFISRVVETRYRRLVISWNASLTYAWRLVMREGEIVKTSNRPLLACAIFPFFQISNFKSQIWLFIWSKTDVAVE